MGELILVGILMDMSKSITRYESIVEIDIEVKKQSLGKSSPNSEIL